MHPAIMDEAIQLQVHNVPTVEAHKFCRYKCIWVLGVWYSLADNKND